MHASLAFLNGAGARSDTAGRDAAGRRNAFLEVLNLLCTTHRTLPAGARAVPPAGARRRASPRSDSGRRR
jgi:hypothetical protein